LKTIILLIPTMSIYNDASKRVFRIPPYLLEIPIENLVNSKQIVPVTVKFLP